MRCVTSGGTPWCRTLLVDGVDDVHARGHRSEQRVGVGQALSLGAGHDEELTPAGVGLTGVGHGDRAQRVLVARAARLRRVLVRNGVAGAAIPGSRRVAGLVHEAGDDPMEDHAVVVALLGQEHEVVDRLGSGLGVERDVERARRRLDRRGVGLARVERHRRRRCVLLVVHSRLGARRASGLDRDLVGLRLQLGVSALRRRGGGRRLGLCLGVVVVVPPVDQEHDADDDPGDDQDDDPVADLLATLLGLGLGGQPRLSRRSLAGSFVAGHGPRP